MINTMEQISCKRCNVYKMHIELYAKIALHTTGAERELVFMGGWMFYKFNSNFLKFQDYQLFII